MFSVILVTTIVVFCLWWSKFNNRFDVPPNSRERLVLRDVLAGRILVRGPGTWFEFPWWQLLARVDLNREPISVPKEKGGDGELIKTSDGVEVLMEYRYYSVSGRRFDKKSGALLGDPEDYSSGVSDEAVILAVTRIDFENRFKVIAEVVQAANEAMLGQYKANQLLLPDKDWQESKGEEAVEVPIHRIEGNPQANPPIPHIEPKEISDAAELYSRLAICIERLANHELTFLGINITGFKITNLKAGNKKLQAEIEKKVGYGHITDAAESLVARSGKTISYREALVADDPQSLGPVAQAEATRDAATAISSAIEAGAKAIANLVSKSK